MPTTPRNTSGGGATGASSSAVRPAPMKRQSSQSSHSSARNAITSPGSVGEDRPLRHHVKPARHTKIILPRNHSSARNLAKLNRQSQNADDGRKHARQRSHEGDTEIRLPGSLGESEPAMKPSMRRNMTSYQLPRNASHAKLKKNLSHGQLTRLGSGRNLAALNPAAQRAPTSPHLKGRSKRSKSAEMTDVEKSLQEKEVALHRQPLERKGSNRKIGFAVGSAGDDYDDEGDAQMEGSGLQEDEWTEESASASPYSTRQNTANNSRRTSAILDRTQEKLPGPLSQDTKTKYTTPASQSAPQPVIEESDDSDEATSPLSIGQLRKKPSTGAKEESSRRSEPEASATKSLQEPEPSKGKEREQAAQSQTRTSPLSQARVHPNPATRRLLNKSQQLSAPALVSNVSALDDAHSSRGSPAPSMRSSRSNLGDGMDAGQEDELVSRFVASASHPSMTSGTNTATSTPKQTGFHAPEEDSTLAAQRRERSGFQIGPSSPGSISAGSSGTNTPALGRSRTELRMLQEKAMADMESAADQRPHLPAHVYDRRNESLKSYLHLNNLGEGRTGTARTTATPVAMGPDVFQGRFRALNTELRVVQKFRDPIGEAVARLRCCKGSRLNQRTAAQQKHAAAGLPTSKSAVSLPAQRTQRAGDLSKSASPPKSAIDLKKNVHVATAPERQKQRREVSFARAPQTREYTPSGDELSPDAIARQLWESI
ncbi:Hypothetical predicted protein [Lecanosticta acicola]|uniref:Uncharacterized protein n=1 Tax=Lecanosticta acicola TaxID=111012 RepID=A0AAI8YUI6_9PEZI|nr:Hypothetical predicted protein [Lecanosticta acicola]